MATAPALESNRTAPTVIPKFAKSPESEPISAPTNPAPKTKADQRLALVEAGRGIAACCIVFHHLSAYGSVPDVAAESAPGMIRFLYDDLRMIVAVFLVFGGFSLAWSTAKNPLTWPEVLPSLGWRFLRLAIPYWFMLGLLLLTAFATQSLSLDPPLVDSFSWPQLLANLVLLQDVLGYGNLSAGTWYLCIDIQFAVLFALISAVSCSICARFLTLRAVPKVMSCFLIPLGIWSAWFWNCDSTGDMYVSYFLAAIISGVLVAWWLRGQIQGLVVAMYGTVVAGSLVVDFRPRLFLALIAATVLLAANRSARLEKWCRPLAGLGKISYSLFLIHYLVNWIVLGALQPMIGTSSSLAWMALIAAAVSSVVAALGLYYGIERPALQRISRLRTSVRSNSARTMACDAASVVNLSS